MNSYLDVRKAAAALLIFIAGGAWIWFSRPDSYTHKSERLSAPQEGFAAPDFQLPALEENTITLSDFQGSPIIINFWASWCPPCIKEMPSLQQIYQEYQSSNLVLLGVNSTHQDRVAQVKEFQIIHQLSFPILLDQTGSVNKLYNIHSLPTTIFIDPEGVIQKIIIGGPLPPALLRIELERILK
jgi:peroxiredoxin